MNYLIKANNIHKKFCRSLRRSLWYGINDIASEITGRDHNHNLRKSEFWALQDVTFELEPAEGLGIVGPNGAGKSTLLKLLNGLIKPDRGRIEVNGRIGALIELGMGFIPVLSGRENIYNNAAVLNISRKNINKKFDEIVEFAGLDDFIDMPVQNYSSGMKVRLGFAVATQLRCDILLIDEILAVGDMAFKDKCFRKIAELKNNGTSIILISHNPHHIFQACDRAIYLDHGILKKAGSVGEVMLAYEDGLPSLTANKSEVFSEKYPGNIIIKKCGFINDSGEYLNEAEVGKLTRFSIQCLSKIIAEDINVTVIVRDLKRMESFRLILSSHIDGKLLSIKKGLNQFDIEFPQLLLSPSEYTFNVKIRRGPMSVECCEPDFRCKVISNLQYDQSIYYQPRKWSCNPVF